MSKEFLRKRIVVAGFLLASSLVPSCKPEPSPETETPQSSPTTTITKPPPFVETPTPTPSASYREPSIALAVSLENPESPSADKAIESFKRKHRFWEKADLAGFVYADSETSIRVAELTFESKLPFYKGVEPLTVTSYRIPNDLLGIPTIIIDDFGRFANYYVYDRPLTVVGARTYNKDGHLLAEALLEYPAPEIINTDQAHFYLHEVHYDKTGRIQFIAKSELDRGGIKIREVGSEGEKTDEYYFFFQQAI